MVLSKSHVLAMKRNRKEIESNLEKIRDKVSDIRIQLDWAIFKTETFWREHDIYKQMDQNSPEFKTILSQVRALKKDADDERKKFAKNIEELRSNTRKLLDVLTKTN